jgi:hypothetical protein
VLDYLRAPLFLLNLFAKLYSNSSKGGLSMKRQTLQEQCLLELLKLNEATRTQLVAQSRNVGAYKNQERGRNRMERKKFSKIANSVKSYNEIDMNKLFKQDILQVNIPVVGESDEYTVTIKLNGVAAEIQKNIKNNGNKFEYRTVIQALTKVFNTTDVYVKCRCPDFKYRFAHWNIIKNVSVDDSSQDPGPGKGITNPNDDKGRGCKHILLCLSNGAWMMKVASVIVNYCHFLSEKKPEAFLKLVFPKLYGVPADEAADNGLVEDNEDLETGKDLIDVVNDWARNRGKFQKGSNKNPVSKTGPGDKKKQAEEKPADEDTSSDKNNNSQKPEATEDEEEK